VNLIPLKFSWFFSHDGLLCKGPDQARPKENGRFVRYALDDTLQVVILQQKSTFDLLHPPSYPLRSDCRRPYR